MFMPFSGPTRLALLSIAIFQATNALAASDSLEKMVITATRTQASIDETPKAISIITGDDIEKAVTSGGIQDLVAKVPGVSYARTGGLGGQLVIRGFSTNHRRAILAIDGERFRGRSTLEYNMYDPSMIERIEIIRGPASAIYGADAMTGVVNIVTRKARRKDKEEAFTMNALLRSASYNSVNNSFGGRAEIQGAGQGFDLMIGANYRQGDDYDTPIGEAENSAFDSTSVDFKLGYMPDDDRRFELSARLSDTMTERAGGLGGSPGAPFKEVTEDPIEEQYLRLSWEDNNFGSFADRMYASAYIRKLDTDIFVRSQGILRTHLRVDSPTVWGGRLTFNKQVGDHSLTWGGDIFREDFDGRTKLNPNGTSIKLDRSSHTMDAGIYVNDAWQITDTTLLQGSLRWDYIDVGIADENIIPENPLLTAEFNKGLDHTDNALTGSIGIIQQLNDDWAATASYSRAFRAADGMVRTISSSAGTIATIPDPQLDSETSDTYEIGLRYDNGNISSNLTAYQSNYDDLITARVINTSPLTYQRHNTGEATIRGIEWDGRWQIDHQWQLRGALMWTHGQDDTADRPLAQIPPLNGHLTMQYNSHDGWLGEMTLRGATKRDRIDTTKERNRPGHLAVDLMASADLGHLTGMKDWQITAGINNLLDQKIVNSVTEENLAFPTSLVGNPLVEPGRAVFVKLVNKF